MAFKMKKPTFMGSVLKQSNWTLVDNRSEEVKKKEQEEINKIEEKKIEEEEKTERKIEGSETEEEKKEKTEKLKKHFSR